MNILSLFGGGSVPKAPDYNKLAWNTSVGGRYNEQTPWGSVNWGMRTGADPNNLQFGDITRSTQLTPQQQGLFDRQQQNQGLAGTAAAGILGDLSEGTSGVSDATYRNLTRYYAQNFGRQQDQLQTQLLNSGVGRGSSAWGNAFDQFQQARDSAYADAADRAVASGADYQGKLVGQLGQLMGYASPTMPQSQNVGQAPDYLSAGKLGYESELDAYNARQAQALQLAQALGQLGTAAYTGGFFPGTTSNINLKNKGLV